MAAKPHADAPRDAPLLQKMRDRAPVVQNAQVKKRQRQVKAGVASAQERNGEEIDGGPDEPASKNANTDPSPSDVEQPSVLIAYQRCRAVRWRPKPVVAISVCPDQSTVAVARENGTVELWNSHTWTLILVRLFRLRSPVRSVLSLTHSRIRRCLQAVPGKEEASITALCWVWDAVSSTWRLFSCGLDMLIVEWHLQQFKPLHAASTLGGAAWHMAAQPQSLVAQSDKESDSPDPLVAVATDDGVVRLHTVEPGRPGVQFRKAVAHADARALHVLWRDDGAVLYAAFSNGCISILDVSSGVPAWNWIPLCHAPCRVVECGHLDQQVILNGCAFTVRTRRSETRSSEPLLDRS
jgi:WD40 repeat protein